MAWSQNEFQAWMDSEASSLPQCQQMTLASYKSGTGQTSPTRTKTWMLCRPEGILSSLHRRLWHPPCKQSDSDVQQPEMTLCHLLLICPITVSDESQALHSFLETCPRYRGNRMSSSKLLSWAFVSFTRLNSLSISQVLCLWLWGCKIEQDDTALPSQSCQFCGSDTR